MNIIAHGAFVAIDHPGRAYLAAAAPWLVLASVAFPLWSVSGMETPLFAATVAGATLAVLQGRTAWAVAALVAATLTRPEGALAAAVLLPVSARGGRRAGALRPAAAYGLFLLALTAFRLAYFGAPLPNTFYAKVGGLPLLWGAHYLMGWLTSGG